MPAPHSTLRAYGPREAERVLLGGELRDTSRETGHADVSPGEGVVPVMGTAEWIRRNEGGRG